MKKISVIEEDNKIKIPDEVLEYLDVQPAEEICLECTEDKIIIKKS